MEVSTQQVMESQGTRLSEKNPWETYGAEMEARMSPEMASEVAEYADRRYESDRTSSENKEELHRQREINTELAKQYQWLNPEEYADYGARIGRVMSHAEFITALRKSGVHCHYRQHPHLDKAVLYVSKFGYDNPEVACWVQIGNMPELSIMRFDDHGVPLDERKRGWRTALLQLILKGIITEEKANKAFGSPKQTEQFHRYNSMLQSFRNAGSSL
jgi:hypothetical protein